MPVTEDVQTALMTDNPLAQGQALWQAIWEPLSILGLTGYTLAGILLGLVLGILLAWFLQHNGWLNRKNRWHHWLLKTYFLLLPLGGIFLGSQAGLIYGSHHQINRYVDTYTPVLQVLADGTWKSFQDYLAEQDMQTLSVQMQQHSIEEVLYSQAQAYLKAQYSEYMPQLDDASFVQRYGFMLWEHLQASYLRDAITEMAVEKTSTYTYMDKQVLSQAMKVPVSQLFKADYLADLFKQQIATLFKPFYLTLWLQLALILAFIAMEAVVSHYSGQMRRVASPVPVQN